jgi:hypothetical protein
MIYNHTLNLVESPMSLLRASKQMRAEVQALIFDSTRRLLVVMRPKGLWVSPNSVFRTTRKARELDAKSALPLTWYLSDLKVPSTLGFRRALLAFVRGMDVRECAYADIDMRVGTVRILGDNVENHSFEFGPLEDGFCSSLQALQEPLRTAIQTMVKEKGSDIFTAEDILCLLKQMSVDWSELLDDP